MPPSFFVETTLEIICGLTAIQAAWPSKHSKRRNKYDFLIVAHQQISGINQSESGYDNDSDDVLVLLLIAVYVYDLHTGRPEVPGTVIFYKAKGNIKEELL